MPANCHCKFVVARKLGLPYQATAKMEHGNYHRPIQLFRVLKRDDTNKRQEEADSMTRVADYKHSLELLRFHSWSTYLVDEGT